MPISSDKICICSKCGKEYTIKTGDNIKSDDMIKLIYCKKCRKSIESKF